MFSFRAEFWKRIAQHRLKKANAEEKKRREIEDMFKALQKEAREMSNRLALYSIQGREMDGVNIEHEIVRLRTENANLKKWEADGRALLVEVEQRRKRIRAGARIPEKTFKP